jgi:hypothetical protein
MRLVFPPILKNVNQYIADFARRLQGTRVIAAGKYPPPATEQAIDRTSDPDRESGGAARKRRLVLRLDEQVQMVGLHGELHDPKGRRRGLQKAAADRGEHDLLPQRRQSASHSQGQMQRMPGLVLGTRPVRNSPPATRRAPRAHARATPSARDGQTELHDGGLHLIMAINISSIAAKSNGIRLNRLPSRRPSRPSTAAPSCFFLASFPYWGSEVPYG